MSSYMSSCAVSHTPGTNSGTILCKSLATTRATCWHSARMVATRKQASRNIFQHLPAASKPLFRHSVVSRMGKETKHMVELVETESRTSRKVADGTREGINQRSDLTNAPHKENLPGSNSTGSAEPPTWPAPRPWAQVVAARIGDVMEDIIQGARRTAKPLPTTPQVWDAAAPGANKVLQLRSSKPVVLVLGTGWGAHSMVKLLDGTDAYELVVVSPRNHFIFTPMLPDAAVGTVEFRSLLEPIRVANPHITYFAAECEGVDLDAKVARCRGCAPFESGEVPEFEVKYDVLVVAVGERPATFGVPGVEQHCFFMKEMRDMVGLRNRIGECFEMAALPNSSEEDRWRLLSFIVVGGGPTGVEFAGTLEDFVRQDLRKKYPELMKYVRVTLLQSSPYILTMFSSSLQQRALENLQNQGVEVRTGVRVSEVNDRQVVLANGDTLDYGVCVWSTGNSVRPLVADMVASLPEQRAANAGVHPAAVKLAVDPYLRVVGAEGVLALGDCSLMTGRRLPVTAQVAGQQGSYLARALNRGYHMGRGGLEQPPPLIPKDPASKTGQGKTSGPWGLLGWKSSKERPLQPFEFLSLGLMAYVGDERALTQVEAFDRSIKLYGAFAFLLWRSVYVMKQVSARNRFLTNLDWLKAKVFGRDLSQF